MTFVSLTVHTCHGIESGPLLQEGPVDEPDARRQRKNLVLVVGTQFGLQINDEINDGPHHDQRQENQEPHRKRERCQQARPRRRLLGPLHQDHPLPRVHTRRVGNVGGVLGEHREERRRQVSPLQKRISAS
jgi:hypothetical protein